MGAPPERAAVLARALERAMRNPEFQKRLIDDGLQPIADVSPDAARAFVAAEVARWTPVARRLGIEM